MTDTKVYVQVPEKTCKTSKTLIPRLSAVSNTNCTVILLKQANIFIRTCILFRVNGTIQNKLLDNELPVHVKEVTFLTNSAIDERIIDIYDMNEA